MSAIEIADFALIYINELLQLATKYNCKVKPTSSPVNIQLIDDSLNDYQKLIILCQMFGCTLILDSKQETTETKQIMAYINDKASNEAINILAQIFNSKNIPNTNFEATFVSEIESKADPIIETKEISKEESIIDTKEISKADPIIETKIDPIIDTKEISKESIIDTKEISIVIPEKKPTFKSVIISKEIPEEKSTFKSVIISKEISEEKPTFKSVIKSEKNSAVITTNESIIKPVIFNGIKKSNDLYSYVEIFGTTKEIMEFMLKNSSMHLIREKSNELNVIFSWDTDKLTFKLSSNSKESFHVVKSLLYEKIEMAKHNKKDIYKETFLVDNEEIIIYFQKTGILKNKILIKTYDFMNDCKKDDVDFKWSPEEKWFKLSTTSEKQFNIKRKSLLEIIKVISSVVKITSD